MSLLRPISLVALAPGSSTRGSALGDTSSSLPLNAWLGTVNVGPSSVVDGASLGAGASPSGVSSALYDTLSGCPHSEPSSSPPAPVTAPTSLTAVVRPRPPVPARRLLSLAPSVARVENTQPGASPSLMVVLGAPSGTVAVPGPSRRSARGRMILGGNCAAFPCVSLSQLIFFVFCFPSVPQPVCPVRSPHFPFTPGVRPSDLWYLMIWTFSFFLGLRYGYRCLCCCASSTAILCRVAGSILGLLLLVAIILVVLYLAKVLKDLPADVKESVETAVQHPTLFGEMGPRGRK